MGRRTILFATIQVVPYEHQLSDGKKEEGKQLVFSDPENGEIIVYPMAKELADKIQRGLKMSNKSLQASLEEEARREQARMMIQGGDGAAAAMPPQAQKAVEDLLKGVPRDRKPSSE